jgi:hypothetical protein
MATCGHNAQAVGMAAALCRETGLLPREFIEDSRMQELQRRLLRSGQCIPDLVLKDPDDLAKSGEITASSEYVLHDLPPDGDILSLSSSRAMLLPVSAGPLPAVTFFCEADERTRLEVEVRGSSKPGNFTPDTVLHREVFELEAGRRQGVCIRPQWTVPRDSYVTYCLLRNPVVRVATSESRVTGVLALSHSQNAAVAKAASQNAPPNSGVESFEFWLPGRRPGGKNLAIRVEPAIRLFGSSNLVNGEARPTIRPNAWVAATDDLRPWVMLRWPHAQPIRRVEITFDTDYDHPLESVLMGHPEREIPFCIKRFRISACNEILYEGENHSTRFAAVFEQAVVTPALKIEVLETRGMPAAIFEVRCYEE